MSHDKQIHYDGAQPAAAVSQDTAALTTSWNFVVDFAKHGKGSARDLPKHVGQLGSFAANAVALMPDIAKRASGEIVIECASMLGVPLADQVELALGAKPKLLADQLRAHLRQQSAAALASLDDKPTVVADLRKQLKGPLGIELPELRRVPSVIYKKSSLIEWYVESTSSTVAAVELAQSDDAGLVATLDALAPTVPQAWGWVDHLHVAAHVTFGPSLRGLANATTNQFAKPKLTKLADSFEADLGKQVPAQAVGKADLAKELDGHDDVALLDAAARAQGDPSVDDKKLKARFAGKPADVVLQYLFTTDSLSANDVAKKVDLLDGSSGSKREHIRTLLARENSGYVIGALHDDRTRKLVRAMAGRDASLRELFEHSDDAEVHASVVKDEALRQWAYEEKNPRSTLWVAVGSGEGAKDGCRLVKSEKGLAWVKQLPRNVPEIELRRLVLNSTDAATTKWVRDNLLHDQPVVYDESADDVIEPSASVYGAGAKRRLDVATMRKIDDDDKTPDPDPDLILRRLAEMTTAERHELFKSPAELTKIFEDIPGSELRAVYLLCPSLPQLLRFPISNMPQLINYVVTRPPKEEVEVANDPTTARRMFGKVSPFTLLPSLVQPATLASALEDNEDLLEWILEETEPNFALKILAKDPVRAVAADFMQRREQVDEDLPAYDSLRRTGRRDFDAIAKDVKDADAKTQVEDYQQDEAPRDAHQHDLDQRAGTVKQAAKAGTLWEAVETISRDPKADISDVLGVVRGALADQQIVLLSGEHKKAVNALRYRVRLGPQHVFPELSIQQLLALPSAAAWLLESEPAFVVLSLLARQPAAIKPMGELLSNHSVATDFMASLPPGSQMTAVERQTLDQLYKHVTNAPVLRSLFEARFDIKSQDPAKTGLAKTFDIGETKKLWAVLSRLPPAQVNQGMIQHFDEEKIEGGAVGYWSQSTSQIVLDEDPKTFADDKKDERYSRGILLTAAEVKEYYGLEGAQLAQAADPKSGWLVQENGKYRVKELKPSQHTATVLHEVGHSIDTLLGDQTELVYKLAGWKQYGIDQFEQWGSEMGAFEGMSAKDRERTAEAWKQALRAGTSPKQLVGSDHPALANAKSPLAKEAKKDQPFSHADTSKQPINGRMFMATKGTLSSVSKKAWDNAPTHYSLTAPAEFFAECYVEYYCGYDGTKQTENKKGGRLALWIKQWFDDHVDKIRLSPDRAKV